MVALDDEEKMTGLVMFSCVEKKKCQKQCVVRSIPTCTIKAIDCALSKLPVAYSQSSYACCSCRAFWRFSDDFADLLKLQHQGRGVVTYRKDVFYPKGRARHSDFSI